MSKTAEKSGAEKSRVTLTMATVVAAKEEAISTDLDGEVIILNTAKGVYFGLDTVGTFIWSSLQKPTRLSAVRDMVLQEYAVDAATCETDLLNLVQNLHSQSLVDVDESSTI